MRETSYLPTPDQIRAECEAIRAGRGEVPYIGEISSEERPEPASKALRRVARAQKRAIPRKAVCGSQSQGIASFVVNPDCSVIDDSGKNPHRMNYLYSGGSFDFANPQIEDVRIEDVAHALSTKNRLADQASERFTVGQHCLLVCDIVRDGFGRPDLEREALLHDAAECYTGDLMPQLKRLLNSDVLRRIDLTVALALGVTYPTPEIVKEADRMAFALKVRRFFPDREQIGAREPRFEIGRLLSPSRVEQLFLDKFHALTSATKAA